MTRAVLYTAPEVAAADDNADLDAFRDNGSDCFADG